MTKKPNSAPFRELEIELGTAYSDGNRMGVSVPTDMLHALRIIIDSLVPFEMGWPDKTACIRYARLYWLSYLVGRDISTSKQLSKGEAVRILRWLEGRDPAMNGGEENEDLAEARQEEVRQWLIARQIKIKIRVVTRAGRRHLKSGGTQSNKS